MPILVLLRHAKAEAPAQDDRSRALAVRGRADAAAAGRWLGHRGLVPDRVVVSPALRTRQTWELAGVVEPVVEPVVDARVYDASVADLLRVLADTPAAVHVLVLVGHDPGLTDLLALLAPGGAARMATCAVAVIELPAWDATDGVLREHAVPRG